MVKHPPWDGHTERREHERRHGWPQVCAEHELIQEHTGEHRQAVCGKISKLSDRLDAEVRNLRNIIVGKWTFNILIVILLGTMGFVVNELKNINADIDRLQKNVTGIMSTLHIRVD
jgi:hypothetical protein